MSEKISVVDVIAKVANEMCTVCNYNDGDCNDCGLDLIIATFSQTSVTPCNVTEANNFDEFLQRQLFDRLADEASFIFSETFKTIGDYVDICNHCKDCIGANCRKNKVANAFKIANE